MTRDPLYPRQRRHTVRALTLALACSLGLGLGPGLVAAHAGPDPDTQRKSQVDKKINALKDDLDGTSQDLRAAYAALSRTQGQLPTARAALGQAQSAVSSADRRNAEAVAALALARANEAKAEAELKVTRGQIDVARSRVAGFASQIYQQQGLGQLSVAMSATSPSDFADRLSMMGTVMDIQEASIGRLSTAEADQRAQEAHLSALRADSVAAQQAAEQALTAASQARDVAQEAKSQLDALAVRQGAQATTLARQKAAEQQQLSAMQAESARLSAVLAERARKARLAAARSKAAPVRATGRFLSAAELGQPITSEYGSRFHPILHIWRMHTGLDFGGACGTPIYAAAPGTIISAGWAGGYGNRVVIDHGMVGSVDLATTYNHMVRIVKFGGHVGRGQLIGYEGTTGMSTGCHLHFETLENGVFVNPRKWL